MATSSLEQFAKQLSKVVATKDPVPAKTHQNEQLLKSRNSEGEHLIKEGLQIFKRNKV